MTDWYFDIETRNWTTFVLACAISDKGKKLIFNTVGEVKGWYRSTTKDDTIWAHNGGKFDFVFLAHLLAGDYFELITSGSRILCLVHPKNAECRDSFALFPCPLRATGEKSVYPLACICGDCEGFCALSNRTPTKSERRLLAEYCMQDCIAMQNLVTKGIGILKDLGFSTHTKQGRMRLTMGSIAWNTAWKLAEKITIKTDDYSLDRSCYYGGRVEPFRHETETVYIHDGRSMYPAAMKSTAMPVGRRVLTNKYREHAFGYVEATVRVPDCIAAPLPFRLQDRLAFPVGTFRGTWTVPELNNAIEYGARVLKVHSARYWDSGAILWAAYIDLTFKCRLEAIARGDEMASLVLKLYMNALSGKFVQCPDMVEWIHTREPMVGFTRYGESDLWFRPYFRLSDNSGPIHAAYTTAIARIELHRRLARNAEYAVYCDTDSTILTRYDAIGEGKELGQWKFEGMATDWQCISPKMYAYRIDGKLVCKTKGIRISKEQDKKESDWNGLWNGQPKIDTRPPRWKEGWFKGPRNATRTPIHGSGARTETTRPGALTLAMRLDAPDGLT